MTSAAPTPAIVRAFTEQKRPMSSLAPLSTLIQRFQEQTPIRTTSLITTLYGDAIEPHGGTAWLGSIVSLLEPIGINERLVRTSVFRLNKEDWLSADKVGRRSYYSLTGAGRRRFETAFRRVYQQPTQAWDGTWSLVMLPQATSEKRKQVREELEWQGFGSLATGLMACPRAERVDVLATLRDLGVEDSTIVFQTQPSELLANKALRAQVRESWNLEELGRQYNEMLQRFRPLWTAVQKANVIEPQDGFLARLLLIHDYRKLTLRDPQLPDELLPGGWEGRAARQLCTNLYRELTPPAEQWLNSILETADGPVPSLSEGFYRRFGGLDPL